MPRWFNPAAAVCAVMFALSPLVIANAPYESTMGLVQKIFYYHMPSAWMFLVAAMVCGIASIRYLVSGDLRHDRTLERLVALERRLRRLGEPALLGVVHEDAAAVLGADVAELTVADSGVDVVPEHVEQLLVRDA